MFVLRVPQATHDSPCCTRIHASIHAQASMHKHPCTSIHGSIHAQASMQASMHKHPCKHPCTSIHASIHAPCPPHAAGPLRESIAADVADDRAEEDEDKDMILGEHMVNPFTGAQRWMHACANVCVCVCMGVCACEDEVRIRGRHVADPFHMGIMRLLSGLDKATPSSSKSTRLCRDADAHAHTCARAHTHTHTHTHTQACVRACVRVQASA